MSDTQKDISCSRCGDFDRLNLVTIRYEQNGESGRVLVYCPPCRNDFRAHMGVCIPLTELTVEMFLDLYRSGKTASDPHQAVSIAFGVTDETIIREVELVLSQARHHGAEGS